VEVKCGSFLNADPEGSALLFLSGLFGRIIFL